LTKSFVRMSKKAATPVTKLMMAATSKISFRPLVKLARSTWTSKPRWAEGVLPTRAATLPFSRPVRMAALWLAKGVLVVSRTTAAPSCEENNVPRRAMPVAIPTCRNVELMPDAMPDLSGCTTPTAVDARGD